MALKNAPAAQAVPATPAGAAGSDPDYVKRMAEIAGTAQATPKRGPKPPGPPAGPAPATPCPWYLRLLEVQPPRSPPAPAAPGQEDEEEEEEEYSEDSYEALEREDWFGLPGPGVLTTIGILLHLQRPEALWFEWKYLQTIHWILTKRWWIVQGGVDERALDEWLAIMNLLELDKRARRDLFLLAQSGHVGRIYANKLLWEFLTTLAIEPPYYDMSHKVVSRVRQVRQLFDRPPRDNKDLSWWTWEHYKSVASMDHRWAPEAVPRGAYYLQTGDDGTPLEPPYCWGTAGPGHRNAGPDNDQGDI